MYKPIVAVILSMIILCIPAMAAFAGASESGFIQEDFSKQDITGIGHKADTEANSDDGSDKELPPDDGSDKEPSPDDGSDKELPSENESDKEGSSENESDKELPSEGESDIVLTPDDESDIEIIPDDESEIKLIPDDELDPIISPLEDPLNIRDLNPVEFSTQESYTRSIPKEYKEARNGRQGTVEVIYYNTRDYYRNDGIVYRKKANVYLPYGYNKDKNKDKKYPILYYMHGKGQNEDTGLRLVNIFDNMIADGLIQPMIVVFPTFYTNNDCKDKEIGNHNQDVYIYEFRNDLMRAVEGKYRTYAKSTSRTDLKESRKYRAFAGLSAGGYITWNTFLENADYVKYFIPLSGYLTHKFDKNGNLIPHNKMIERAMNKAENLKKQGLKYKIVECCGTADNLMTENVRFQYSELIKNKKRFSMDKYVMLWTKGAKHEFRAFNEGLFTALLLCFPGKNYK